MGIMFTIEIAVGVALGIFIARLLPQPECRLPQYARDALAKIGQRSPIVSGCSDIKRLTELMAKFVRGEELDDEENRELLELRKAEASFDAAPVGDVKTLSLLVSVYSLIEREAYLTIEKLTTILPDIIIRRMKDSG
jgi:hypothetical protein